MARLRRPLLLTSTTLALCLAVAVLTTAAVPSAWVWALQASGRWVIDDEALKTGGIERAEVAVVSMDAGNAGVLEAADLVREGVVSRVAVFRYPRNAADLEILRRGVHVEDMAERSTRVLRSMGVSMIDTIDAPDAGTEAESRVLPTWLDHEQMAVVIVVTASDHSRRVSRVLRRAMRGHRTRLVFKVARHSAFDPDGWWHSNTGRRIWIVEAQKLLLDVLRHPRAR